MDLLSAIKAARKTELVEIGSEHGIELNIRNRKCEIYNQLIEELVEQDALPPSARMEIIEDKETLAHKTKLAEIQKEIELAKVEADKQIQLAHLTGNKPEIKHEHNFDVSRYTKLLPEFDQNEPDLYFEIFEKLVTQLGIDNTHWSILIQSKLIGKAMKVVTAMSSSEMTYAKIKEKILGAYEQIPSAHLRAFREYRKKSAETYTEFASNLTRLMDRWTRSCDAQKYDTLREQVLIEQFTHTLDTKLRMFIAERDPQKLAKAAELADQFTLIHGAGKSDTYQHKSSDQRQSSHSHTYSLRRHEGNPSVSKETHYQQKSGNGFRQGYGYGGRSVPTCYYCHKVGHTETYCRKKNQNTHHTPVLTSKTDSGQVKPTAKKVVKKEQGAESEEAAPVLSHNLPQNIPSIDKRFTPFLMTGTVAMNREGKVRPVKILRDTGAIQTLILTECLDDPDTTYLHKDVIIETAAGYRQLPLHSIYLETEIVKGQVTVAAIGEMPVAGIQLLLSNDLAGDQVKALIVSEKPLSNDEGKDDPNIFPVCAVTRAQTRRGNNTNNTPDTSDLDDLDLKGLFYEQPQRNRDEITSSVGVGREVENISRELLCKLQREDETLTQLRDSAVSKLEVETMSRAYYLDDGVLMRRWVPPRESPSNTWMACSQIVAPSTIRQRLLLIAHDTPLAGHVGIRKTLSLLTRHFYWPGIQKDVANYCKTCETCQRVGKANQRIPKAPLHPIPVMEEPFSRILVDCVGPLPKSKGGFSYLLTVMCLSTRFPEAIPLRNIRAKTLVKALIKYFTIMGFPKEIQSDRGSNFMSIQFKQALTDLGIHHIVSTPYHPESQGAIERFHGTLKTMLRKYTVDFGPNWEDGLPMLLFAVRSTVQESTGYSPAELVFGHDVRGPIRMFKEHLLNDEGEGISLMDKLNKMKIIWKMARENLHMSQRNMKKKYDKKTLARSFEPGDRVLLYLPKPGESLQAKFQGPYTVLKQTSPLNYVIETPDRHKKTRLCHINTLKAFHAPKVVLTQNNVLDDNTDNVLYHPDIPLKNTLALQELPDKLQHLDTQAQHDIVELVHNYPNLFTDVPRQHTDIEHQISLLDDKPIRQTPYRLNPEKREILRKEVASLLAQGLIEPSKSPYASPCLLVPKPDGSQRLVVDFRKLNNVTKGDAYPLPRIDDLLDFVGSAKYVTKIDLLKGYHQIALHASSKEKTAFVTPDGLYQYTVLPFGLRNAPASFQRMVSDVIAGLPGVKSYIDDIVICTKTWDEHMALLYKFFDRVEKANLTINLEKSEFGQAQITYLGHVVGNSTFSPLEAKTKAIQDLPVPKSKKEIRRFLGCVGFYRKFCHNFAAISTPLTNLLRKDVKFQWGEECQTAFDTLRQILSNKPVLKTPVFDRPYHLFVDSSEKCSGAVLMQQHEGILHSIAYFSKQLNKAQRNYSTVEKECLAVVLALKHFEAYLSPTQITHLYTDHNPLVSLNKLLLAKSNARLARWSLLLQSYNLNIQHIAGKDNVIADLLSRS